jgi:phosphatidylinositol-3-phosphatase
MNGEHRTRASGVTARPSKRRRTVTSALAAASALAAVTVLGLVIAGQHGAAKGRTVVTQPPAGAPSTARGHTRAPTLRSLHLAHIFVIVEENKSYSEIVHNPAAPYLNKLIARSALATNYFALFHPSLPNYIALTSGSNHGIVDDRSPPSAGNEIAVANLADRIQAGGRTWKEYAESMPSAGYAFDQGLYATKHNPFIYYQDIAGRPRRDRTHVVPFTRLAKDLRRVHTTPNFAFITPNLCNDMHDCPVASGDQWLARTVPLILQSRAFRTSPSLLVVTWDEGTSDNHIATILAGNSVRKGYRSARRYDHYSLLRTIEAAWRLAPLTANDAHAHTLRSFFK